MAYFIYENWRAGPHKVVLHADACGSCNNGEGIGGGTDPRNGKWHGPFSTLAQARSAHDRLPASQVPSAIRRVQLS
jgi:hypothetical protein